MKVGEEAAPSIHGHVTPRVQHDQVESSPYRPCLMVADTSEQSPECSSNKKVRRPRTCFSDEQLKELEGRFRINKYVSVADRTLLCSELGLTDSQIKTWFQNRRTKWKRLNEARYNLLSGGSVDDRLLRKEMPYYNSHPGLTIPSFQNKLTEHQSTPGSGVGSLGSGVGSLGSGVGSLGSGVGSLGHVTPHNLYAFSNNFHSFPNYMWGSYSHGYNPQSTSIAMPSASTAPLTTHTSSYSSALNPLNTPVTPLTALNSSLTPMSTPLSPGIASPVISPPAGTPLNNHSNPTDTEEHSSTGLHPDSQQQFHALYPPHHLARDLSRDKDLYAGSKEGPGPCVSYSPYYSPYMSDKSLRAQYHSTANLTT